MSFGAKHTIVGLGLLAAGALALWLGGQSGPSPEDEAGAADPASSEPAQAAKPAATPFGWVAQIAAMAGDGHAGLKDGAAAEARFADPYGIAFDAGGVTYIADGGDNNRIRRRTIDGQVSTLAGGHAEGLRDGRGSDAAFHTPSGLALDAAGNLYVADTGNHAVRKVTPDGTVTTLAGTGQAGFRDGPASQALFNGPMAVAVDDRGRVFVADAYNDRIRVITPDGQVATLAGGDAPGWVDGPTGSSRLDTPCGLALDAAGNLWIADTRNHAIRKLYPTGELGTVLRPAPEDELSPLRRPLALAVTADGHLFVTTMRRGNLLQISPALEVHEPLKGTGGRFSRPTGLALDGEGHPLVADAGSRRIYHVAASQDIEAEAAAAVDLGPAADHALPDTRRRWPLAPQRAWHEVVGTAGEVRGDGRTPGRGEPRDHLHDGLDVRGDVGASVFAIADGKVDSPLGSWGYGQLGEGLSIGLLHYIHVRVGRSAKGEVLDATRFELLRDEAGKPERVRVRRGTRFRAGEMLGSINAMAHVHLGLGMPGFGRNPMQLGFEGFVDQMPPRIEGITLFDLDGQPLSQRAGGRVLVPRATAGLHIVVDAWDQVEGNLARRRLGLRSLGWQLLRGDGTPAPGFEQPRVTLDFDRLPHDEAAAQLAYAADSGITVHGSARTRFRYQVTNSVRDGRAAAGQWVPELLPAGDYTLRIVAWDHAGNPAVRGTDLALRLQ